MVTLIKVGNVNISPHHHDASGLDQLGLAGVRQKDATGLLYWTFWMMCVCVFSCNNSLVSWLRTRFITAYTVLAYSSNL